MSRDDDFSRDFQVVNNTVDEEEYFLQNNEKSFEEETAMEYVPERPLETYRPEFAEDEDRNVEGEGSGFATIAIISSIASLFFWPMLLGIVGVIFGFFAAGKGRRGIGYTAVAIGIFSIILNFFANPFVS